MLEREIEAAVTWWAKQLQLPQSHDVGSIALSAYTDYFQDQAALEALSDEQITTFKQTLTECIVQAIEGDRDHRCIVDTDYGPGYILNMAVAAAQIDHANFRLPAKTIMWIEPGRVDACVGYAGKHQCIYAEDEKVPRSS